tara:strand:- start:155 stop:526 length:372 start_codon:yes stop_codon:yes gene_type:complete
MSYRLYQYNKCSTCRAAIKFLKAKEIEFEVIDISSHIPSSDELNQVIDFYNGDHKKLFNTAGRVYRELGLKDKVAFFSREEAIAQLRSDGMLIKRPLLISNSVSIAGFNGIKWEEAIKKGCGE